MATTKHEPMAAKEATEKLQQRVARIGTNVLRALGQPAALHALQVRPLWDNCFRVNVFVGAEATCVTLAHSFFLVTDPNGDIVTSAPPITKQY